MGVREIVNSMLAPLGMRMVNARWGPRGEWAPFRRVRDLGFQPRQIVDAGAFRGFWTRECLAVFPDAQYFLVDPLPENAPYLQALAKEKPNCRVFHGGLGEEAATRTFFRDGMRSSLLKSDVFKQPQQLSIDIRTLDSFLDSADLQPPDIIKADVQGYELQVLRGARRCLESAKLVLLEVSFREFYVGNPMAHDVIAQLSDWGFGILDICTYHVDGRNGELLQSDLLFCRKASPWLSYDGGTPMSPVRD